MSYDLETMDRDKGPQRAGWRGLDRLYDRVIRDLFGRAVPGILLLLSLAISVNSFAEVALALERATVWMWILAFGAGWIAAFAVLEIGRRFNLALLSPAPITDVQYWDAEERFRATASRRQHAEYDRLVAIRDATAAASVSLFVSLIAICVDFVVDVNLGKSPSSDIGNWATSLAILVIIGIALQLAHREYVKRTWRYLGYTAGDRDGSPASPA